MFLEVLLCIFSLELCISFVDQITVQTEHNSQEKVKYA
jgi:hypothetical protein